MRFTLATWSFLFVIDTKIVLPIYHLMYIGSTAHEKGQELLSPAPYNLKLRFSDR